LGKWAWPAPADGANYDMLAVPAIDAAGQRLYVGNDRGDFRCLNTANGSVVWTYSVTNGTNRAIRSGAALDPERPGAPAVYFHCNNGYLYALNAQTGAFLWSAYTANVGAPVDNDFNPLPVSSTPVVGANGNVYVGTAKANNTGSLRAFIRSNGASLWELQLGAPVEASPAIGANGWIYVGTRMVLVNQTWVGGNLHGIDPTIPSVMWSDFLSPHGGPPGLIASPVIDRDGFVYQAEYHDFIWKLDPWLGDQFEFPFWSDGIAKHCQPLAITHDGLMILGTSMGKDQDPDRRTIRAYDLNDPSDTAVWKVTHVNDERVGDFLGSAAVRVNSPITYIADMNGRVYRFDAGSALMESPWPTFQCGNRRAGKFGTEGGGYHLLELPGYYYSVYPPTPRAVNRYGVAVGQAYGYPAYPYGSGLGFNAAKWHNGVLNGSWGYYYVLGSYATGINTSGDAVGFVDDGFYRRPLYWAANLSGYPTYLPLPSGFTPQYSFASDIADDGTIIGYGRQSSTTNVIRWTKSGGSYIANSAGSPAGGNQAFAYAYSNAKRFAGKAVFNLTDGWRAYVTGQDAQSFLTVSGLGTLGGSQSEAWDVHDDSGTVGWAHNSSGRRRAFRVPIGVTSVSGRELPRLEGTSSTTYNSEAYGINRYGSVVGSVQNDSGAYRAFVFTMGQHNQLANLSNIILASGQTPADLGWVLTSAIAINDSGTMVGVGTKDGSTRAWLLEPRE
jgi:probable HAF family extracellular repeat protein